MEQRVETHHCGRLVQAMVLGGIGDDRGVCSADGDGQWRCMEPPHLLSASQIPSCLFAILVFLTTAARGPLPLDSGF